MLVLRRALVNLNLRLAANPRLRGPSKADPHADGPAPWEWRGKIRTSRGCAHGHPFHAEPCLDRGAIAEGRGRPLPVVEDLDVIEPRRFGFLTGAEAGVVNLLLLQRGEEGLHRRVVETVAAPAH